MNRALQILIHRGMINGEPACRQVYLSIGRQTAAVINKKIKCKQMNRALQILIHKEMINGEPACGRQAASVTNKK